MVSPAARKEGVRHLIQHFGVSERHACRVAQCSRATLRRVQRRTVDNHLVERLRSLAYERPRFGYRRVHVMLRREGFSAGQRHVRRIYRMEGLAVRRRKRKRIAASIRAPRVLPTRPNERWSMDFVHDQIGDGRRFRTFNVVDDFTRECLAIEVSTSFSGTYVTRILDKLLASRGQPKSIVVDNGTEFTSIAFDQWAHRHGIEIRYIRPGKPVENAYAESFNGRFRDECLNQEWFASLTDAREAIARWRTDYNTVRPHSSIGNIAPAEFALNYENKPSTQIAAGF